MGRKAKYSAKSDVRMGFRITQNQKETLENTQLIHKARQLPHTEHDVWVAALKYYYDYLLKDHEKRMKE